MKATLAKQTKEKKTRRSLRSTNLTSCLLLKMKTMMTMHGRQTPTGSMLTISCLNRCLMETWFLTKR